MAGGNSPSTKAVYISQDFGQTNSLLTNLPYGGSYIRGGCLLIVNTTTIFVSGGYGKAKCSTYSWWVKLKYKFHHRVDK